MSSREQFVECNQMSRGEARRAGSSLWDVRRDSPGNSLRLPSATRFRIAYEGPKSRIYAHGVCQDGFFVVTDRDWAGSYSTANEAVQAVRSHVTATNACLYVEFEVDREWISADELRYDPELSYPDCRIEQEALKITGRLLRERDPVKVKGMSRSEFDDYVERVLEKNPQLWESAREGLELVSKLEVRPMQRGRDR